MPVLQIGFGLNHDRAVLDALWTPYARAARPLLVSPVQQDLEGQLVDLGQMQTAQIDTQSSQMAQDGQQALKTYLMMAEPQRAEAAFLTPQLEHHWNIDTGLRPGEKLDYSAQLMGFWAQHFPTHPDWRIQPREDLVGSARQTLLAIIGVKNSEDTIYQGILDSVGHKYPDQTLASLTAGTDIRLRVRPMTRRCPSSRAFCDPRAASSTRSCPRSLPAPCNCRVTSGSRPLAALGAARRSRLIQRS